VTDAWFETAAQLARPPHHEVEGFHLWDYVAAGKLRSAEIRDFRGAAPELAQRSMAFCLRHARSLRDSR
jgi:hypothetical protein